jgi:GT2 family glycosyltransferase
MLRQLLNGRPAQKRGVLDFLKGIEGPPPYQKIETGIYTYPIRLSIIISNYKTPHLIDQLLKSIYKKDSGFDKNKDEVIVLDDASGDKCKEVVEKYKEVKFLQNSVNKKFVAANNRLLEYTRGELILMLNSDMEVKSGALSTLIETSKKFNNEVVLAGNLIFPDGRDQDSCFFLPTVMGAIKEYFLGKKGSYVMFRPLGNKPVQVECAVMACFLIPRKVLNKIGYLNRNLVMYFEDVDYCRRLKRAGIPLYYVPRAEFAHHHGASSKIIGQNKANDLIIQSSKTYHGRVYYTLLTTTLWAAQKYQKLIHFLRIDKASN